MSLFLETKYEENASRRARSGKIKKLLDYKGLSPGNLDLEVSYQEGCLTVYLGSANLAGKRSQDPYALVYLLASDGLCYFQQGKNQTEIFDKNIQPDFDSMFQFKMSLNDVMEKKLVVAIWDNDTKSNDDYMAGVTISMKDVSFFQEKSVKVNLEHQEKNGHPAEVPAKNIFGIKTSSSWDLKTCNNKLVSFIDRARVLAEAYEMKGSLPTILQEWNTMMPPDASKAFEAEIENLQSLTNGSRSKLMSAKMTLKKMKSDNENMTESYQNFQYTLKERQEALYGLEIRETELSAKCSSLDYLKEQIRILEMRINTERARLNSGKTSFPDWGDDLRISESHFHESTLNMPSVGGISSGSNSRESERQEYHVKISTEYLLKMRAALNKARQQYQKNYEMFILRIEKDADEIMHLYEEIIKERSSKSTLRKSNLLDIERSRAYEMRINQLKADVRDIDMKIGNSEGKLGGLDSNYKTLFGHLDSDMNGLKAKLRALFVQFTEYTKTRYNEVNEVSIYGQLLDYEEGRLIENRPVRKVTVSESVVRASQRAEMTVGGSISSSYGQGYSVKEMPKRRESGYSSPGKTPDDALDHGMQLLEFEHVSGGYGESGFSNSTRTTVQSRSSRSSMSGSGHVGRTSAMFDNIKDDVFLKE
eukprot:GFUD01034537.1.p1 GENE.GFUD01034537.1~~GFUD01034537.1.p1  ORF type:complete len:648 (+),score=175.65 GFUD01034537.1:48-1991(+)